MKLSIGLFKALILELLAIEYLVIGAPYSSFLSAYDQLVGHQFLVLLLLIIIGKDFHLVRLGMSYLQILMVMGNQIHNVVMIKIQIGLEQLVVQQLLKIQAP